MPTLYPVLRFTLRRAPRPRASPRRRTPDRVTDTVKHAITEQHLSSTLEQQAAACGKTMPLAGMGDVWTPDSQVSSFFLSHALQIG